VFAAVTQVAESIKSSRSLLVVSPAALSLAAVPSSDALISRSAAVLSVVSLSKRDYASSFMMSLLAVNASAVSESALAKL
jgi:hypothetical protein